LNYLIKIWLNQDGGTSLSAPRLAQQEKLRRRKMSLGTILLIILILILVGALPNWGYSRNWGYFPSGGLGLVLVVVLILVLMGKL
jgi:hypothetical protein